MGIISQLNKATAWARAITDIAKSGGDSATVIADLTEKLITARKQVSTLEEEKLEIEKRLADFSRFENERDQYVMTTLKTGAVVYELKRPQEGQGRVYYCANCSLEHRLSILQPKDRGYDQDTYLCQPCGSTVLVPGSRKRPNWVDRQAPERV